jgi:small multidrug resistance family-3 protein
MEKLAVLGFLVVATTLEAFGDAIVRVGLNQQSSLPRGLLFLGGATLLFGYGLSLNLAPLGISARRRPVYRNAVCRLADR